MVNLFFNDQLLIVFGATVHRGPVFGVVFLAEVVLAGAKGFQSDGTVAVIVVTNAVKVVVTTLSRSIFTPIVWHSFIGDRLAGFELGNAVRTASQGRFKR